MKNMKYKVLAADDEFWSRENIRNLIPWEEYSLEFLEPACDGEEVIERIAEEKPDIILTDINMPFLSGLELLQRLQNEYPEIITIAISGYDDFDKVKIQVGQILSVEPVKGSSKLLMFKLDFGDGKERQILSGIRKFYPDASELLDKKVLAVTNLKPRKMLGHLSEGMLLSSEKDGEIKLALVEDEHANGAELG